MLCPMQIERRAVVEALSGWAGGRAARRGLEGDPLAECWDLGPIRVIQTGIGQDAVVRALRAAVRVGESGARPVLVVLAGLCGGLVETVELPRIDEVVDEHGARWACGAWWNRAGTGAGTGEGAAEKAGETGGAGVRLVGVDRVVSSPAEKAALARSSGAEIVDMESHAFIRACEEVARDRGAVLCWSVVRGVSDTPGETLPGEVVAWLDERGNTRTLRALRDLACKPRLIPHIYGVMRRSSRVLPKVGARTLAICEQWLKSAPDSASEGGVA